MILLKCNQLKTPELTEEDLIPKFLNSHQFQSHYKSPYL